MHINEAYIMGAGKFGETVYNQLSEYKEYWKVLGYIDSDINKKNMIKDGIRVFHISDSAIMNVSVDVIIFIAITDKEERVKAAYTLNNIGFLNLFGVSDNVFFHDRKFVISSNLDSKYVKKYRMTKEGFMLPVFPYLETHVTNGCNLKCQGCSHFSNLFSAESTVDFEQYKNDVVRLGEICDVMQLRLLGGEPLLNKNILQYMKVARQAFPDTDVRVVTNGILITKCDEAILQYMSDNRIIFDITLYEAVAPMKESIIKRLEKYRVLYHLFEHRGEFEKMLTLCGDKDPQSNIDICSRKICLTLKEGNLYRCAVSAHVARFNEEYGTNIESEVLFNIYKDSIERLREVALEYPDKPVATCRYCLNPPVSFRWKPSVKPMKEEWLV